MNTQIKPRLTEAARPRWALFALRLMIGYGFAAHGYAKLARGPEHFARIVAAMGLPLPLFFAWLTVAVELFGGIALVFGAGVAWVSVPLVFVMLVALFEVHLPYGFSSIRLLGLDEGGAHFGPVGYELSLLYICALIALALSPATPFGVDHWVFANRSRSPARATAPSSPVASE